MKRKLTLFRYLWIFILLIACGPLLPQQTITLTMKAPTFMPVSQTPTSLPTFAPFPVYTPILQTPTMLPTFTPTPNQPFSMDRIRTVYVKDGNIYLRDGLNPPKQLTHSGKDRNPILSDDGEKIVFYRGEAYDDVYSINADGTQEQIIIMSKSLPVFGRGVVESRTFAADTHKLLFNTFLCEASKGLYVFGSCTVGIFIVDTDSGEIKELVVGLSGHTGQGRNFEVSPNGKYLSVAALGHIDIFNMDGNILYNPINYLRTTPGEFLPVQYWLPDSSGLIAVVATDPYNEPGTPPGTYNVFRFTIKDRQATQIPFGISIMWNSGCSFSVSPDGNWVYYLGNEANSRIGMTSLYLGNLNDGHTQAIEWSFNVDCPTTYSQRWSPDGRYYAFEKDLVAVDGTSIPIDGHFSDWIDADHYIYTIYDASIPKTYTFIGEIGGESIALPEDFVWSFEFVILDPETTP